ncbi:MAG: hypothetical protein ABI562_06815 [Chloroflexota bacterium]
MTSTKAPAPIPTAPPVGFRATLAAFGWPPLLLIAAAVAILVWLGRNMTFYHDEFAFLLLRDLSADGILAPHNEHLSATLVLLYQGLLATVGTASYWPYLGVTYALHVIVAVIVYVVVRRETNATWALGALAVMLLLGSGGDDILWAFQSGPVGATAAGMAAVVLAPRRPAIAALLLTVALFTSGASLAFLVATGAHLALTRPRALAWLALPVGLYLAWYIGFGASHIQALRSPSLDGVPVYVLYGLAASAAGVIGSTVPAMGVVVLVALVVGFAWTRSAPPVVIAMLVSSVAFFAIAGLVRAQFGPEQAAASRYVYVAAPGLLIAGAVLLARLPRRWRNVAGAVLLAIALVGNVGLLVERHDRFLSMIECERSMTPIARGSAGNLC